VLGVAIRSDDPIPGLVASLRDKKMLLVFDSCEHVLNVAVSLAEQVLRGAPGVHILATSREVMRAEGERVQRLGPLGVPATTAGLTAADALAYPAVQLFVERATESLDTFELTDAEAEVVADVCRRLDGIALAIELAAGRVDAFGVKGLAAHLDDRFRLLMRGRRTALPRHRTLSATLDWSYEALPEQERVILRRLGVFAGAFTIEAAASIVADPEVRTSSIIEPVANLVAKSLVVAEVGGVDVRYRLLDTTRAYARQKLEDCDELETFARHHAEFYLKLFERAETERQKIRAAEWLAAYGYQIDNLRSALSWAFSPRGDVALSAALTLAAVPLWFQLSLINECRESVPRALAACRSASNTRQSPKDGVIRRAGLVVDVYDGARAPHRRGLADCSGTCRTPRQRRLPTAGALGALGEPLQQRRVPRGARARRTLLRRRDERYRSWRSVHWRSDDGRRVAFLRQSDGRAEAHRAHAQPVYHPR